jgi:CheY-like chemotaxis protein
MPTERILIVEDNLLAQKIAAFVLKSLQYEFDIAGNGNQAIDLFRENAYDLIFMDIGLPDISGYETTKAIRALEKDDAHVPIVAITVHAEGSNELAVAAREESGIDGCLDKPLTSEKVEQAFKDYAGLILPS